MCALLGIATKFYTCSLAVMYRGKTRRSGAGRADVFHPRGWGKCKPLAIFLLPVGCLVVCPFAIESVDSDCKHHVFEPQGWFVGSDNTAQVGNALFGLLLAVLVGMVVVGGIKRIGAFAARLVPGMVFCMGNSL